MSPPVSRMVLESVTCVCASWDGCVVVVGGSAGHVWVLHEGRKASTCQPAFNLTDAADEVSRHDACVGTT